MATRQQAVTKVVKITTPMNIAFFTWENVYWLSQLLLVLFAGIALVSGRIVNNRQAVEIETLRNKNLELEARVTPRRLTGVQKESLSKFLADDPGAVAIVSNPFDPETSDFADDFDSAIRDAKWDTARIRNHTDGAGVRYGVFVGTFEGTTLGDTQRISDALRSIGVAHEIKTFGVKDEKTMSPYFEKGVLYLVIEHKPVPTTPK